MKLSMKSPSLPLKLLIQYGFIALLWSLFSIAYSINFSHKHHVNGPVIILLIAPLMLFFFLFLLIRRKYAFLLKVNPYVIVFYMGILLFVDQCTKYALMTFSPAGSQFEIIPDFLAIFPLFNPHRLEGGYVLLKMHLFDIVSSCIFLLALPLSYRVACIVIKSDRAWLNISLIFNVSGMISSKMDSAIWGSSYDWIYLIPYTVLDLKDIYLFIGFLCFIQSIIENKYFMVYSKFPKYPISKYLRVEKIFLFYFKSKMMKRIIIV
jgi:hypothetical protein